MGTIEGKQTTTTTEDKKMSLTLTDRVRLGKDLADRMVTTTNLWTVETCRLKKDGYWERMERIEKEVDENNAQLRFQGH